MRIHKTAAGAALALLSSGALAGQIHEGRWTYSMTLDMPNMPAMPDMSKIDASKLPPGVKLPQRSANGGMQMSFDRCVTNADLVPQKDQQQCKITKMDRQGDTVNWASVCDTPHGKMNATGTATYSGETMTATTKMTGTDAHGKPIDMTQKIEGHYAGACTQ